MARIEDIERRLLNWARWRAGAGGGGLGYTSVDLTLANAGRDGYLDATVPTLDVEAEETDRGLNELDYPLREAVYAGYLGGGSMKTKAQRLGCSEATLYARIDQAHYRLSSWLSGRAAAAREQRQRMEALQQTARPGAKRSFTE